jgi:hypothetical protein
VVCIPDIIDLLQAAQMRANPPSMHFILNDFVDLEEDDWIIQNVKTLLLANI